MRVLFALTSNQEEKIAQTYKEKYGEVLDVNVVYFFKSLIDTVKKSAPFDRIIIHEEFESVGRKNRDVYDEYLFQNLDRVTDESNGACIIFLASEQRRNDDKLLNKLFNIGIYNILIGQEGTLGKVCELIKNPRTKKDAKRYLEVDIESTVYEDPNKVSEVELRNILEYYEKNINNEEKIISGFDNNLYEQYTIQKLKTIIAYLPSKVRDILYKSSDKYRAVLGEVVKIVEVPVYIDSQQNKIGLVQDSDSSKFNQNKVSNNDSKNKKNFFGFAKKDKNYINKNQLESKQVDPKIIEQNNVLDDKSETVKAYYNDEENSNIPKVLIELQESSLGSDGKQNISKDGYSGKTIEFSDSVEVKKIELEPFSFDIPAMEEVKEEPINIEIPVMEEIKEEPLKIEMPIMEEIREESVEIEMPVMEEIKEEPLKIEMPVMEEIKEEPLKIEMPVMEEVKEEPLKIEMPIMEEIKEEPLKIEMPIMEEIKEEPLKIEMPMMEEVKEEPLNTNSFNIENSITTPGGVEQFNAINGVSKPSIQTVTQVIEKEVIKEVFETPSDYKKAVAFIGAHKVGTTFIINAIASMLTSKGIKTAILDLTNNKSTYSIYAGNNTEYKRVAASSIKNLVIGQDAPLKIGDLSVYTGIPVYDRTKLDVNRAIEKIRGQNAVILIDCDISTPIDVFRRADSIFVIQDMDLLNITPITMFIKELKNRDIELNKIEIIINKYVKSMLTVEKIVEGISYYTNPEMTFIDELLPKELKRYIIPFDEQNYVRYIEALYSAKMNFAGFSDDFKQAITSLTHEIFPISSSIKANSHQEVIKPTKKGGLKNLFQKK